MADQPGGLHRYEVSFYAKMPDERLIYVLNLIRRPSTVTFTFPAGEE
jgi:hypothetical protein